MAFYFALFNVSNVNQELREQRKAQKRERRRHSLATASHVAKDYRLLPRPKVISHDKNNNADSETLSTLVDDTENELSVCNSLKYLNLKESIKQRRASSPESRHAMDIAFNEPFAMAEVERHLKRVKFNSPSMKTKNSGHATKDTCTDSSDEEQIWVKRTESAPQNLASEDDPWVYSVDLSEQQEKTSSARPPLANRTRMGVSALELHAAEAQTSEQNPLRDNLQRHVNTWPDIRPNRVRWRPTLLIRRHSGGSTSDNDRLISMLQRRIGNSGSHIPYQSITPTLPAKTLVTNPVVSPTTSQGSDRSRLLSKSTIKAQKSTVVITPTGRQSAATNNNFRSNLNSWAQQTIYRSRLRGNSNVPFLRLNDDGFKPTKSDDLDLSLMSQSSIF